jgi:hypothetical protein
MVLHTGKSKVGSRTGHVLLSREHLDAAIKGEEATEHGEPIDEQDPPPVEKSRPPPKRGRRQKYDWESFDRQVIIIAHYDGLPKTQAELEKKILQWCENTWERQPGVSTVRERLGPLYRKLLEEDYISES